MENVGSSKTLIALYLPDYTAPMPEYGHFNKVCITEEEKCVPGYYGLK